MSEGSAPEGASLTSPALPLAPRTAGGLLRLAREREGLHIAALAVSMKVPVKKLEALESDRLDLLPDAVFVRALAGSVCRALNIDPRPVLELLPASQVPKLDVGERGINTPFSTPGQANGFSLIRFLAKPQSIAVVAIMLAAVGVLLYPESVKEDHVVEAVFPSAPISTTVINATAEVPETSASVPIATSLPASQTGASSNGSAAIEQAPPPVPMSVSTGIPAKAPIAVTVPVVNVSSTNGPSPVSPTVAHTVAGTVPLAPTAADILAFKAKGTVWVQVKDSKGLVLLSKTLTAGEVATAGGATPLAVVVGRADLTSVTVRGKEFNLSAVAPDNVARFEVK